MTWKTMEAPQVPANLSSVATEQGDALTWDYSSSGAHRFAIYLSNDDIDALTIIGNPVYLAKVTYEKQVLFSDINIASGSKIVVTAISQIGQESNPSDIYQLDIELPQVELLSPDEGSIVGFTSELAWQSNIADATFFVQIATNQSFGNVVYSSGWVADSVLTIADLALEGETIYYWRVKAKDVSEGPYSVYQSFTTGFPDVPQLIYPGHLEQNIAQQPKIRWNASLITDQIEVIISDDINSTNIVAQELFSATNGEAILNTKLGKETWYYLKIRAINNFGHSYFAGTHAFKTSAGEIPVVSLVAPEDNAVAASFDFLQWQTSTTEGTISFLLEIAVDEAFNSIISSSGWLSTTELSIADLKLEGGRNYYWRVKAKSEFGEGDFSEIRNYLAGYPARPAISSPLHLSENADINPLIIWSASADSDSMLIEFSEQSNYTGIAVSGMLNASLGEGKVNKNLSPLTWYYLRIKAINEFGSSIYSSNKYFKTGEGNALIEKNNSPIELYPTIINQGGATLKVHLSVNSALTVNVLNILGQNVYQLVPTKVRPAGYYDFLLDASKVNTKGIYYLQILIDNQVYSKKLLIQ